MRDRTVNRVESWDARPFSGGFATLRDLADGGFSGVVVSGDVWLFMLNGRVVGIVDGDIDDFDDASGTMYEAPDPALPLLFSMQERDGSTQAKYYTNDTPLEEADQTLRDANFTGYVELSENVLSGDYYLVYYGGRVLPVAFVGTTEELKTGDSAYDLAADEVGVYEVIKTPVNVTQVPAAPESEDAGAAGAARAGGAGAAAGAAAAGDSDADGETPSDGAASDTTESPEPGTADMADRSGADPSTASDGSTATNVATPTDASPATDASASSESVADQAEPDRTQDSTESRGSAAGSESRTAEAGASDRSEESDASASASGGDVDSVVESAPDSESTEPSNRGSSASRASDSGSPAAERSDATSEGEEGDERTVFSEEEQWRKTKSIPSLTPTEREKRRQAAAGTSTEQESQPDARRETTDPDSDQDRATRRKRAKQSQQSAPESRSKSDGRAQEASSEDTQEQSASAAEKEASSESSASTTALQERIGELESELERVGAERNSLADDLESVESERDELERRVRQLEEALEEAGGKPTAGPTLTPHEALAGTNLFIRYGSKGAPTLDDLAGKTPDPEAINKNLRIDHHTQFESKDASVNGAPFEQFLERSPVFRFVSWLVRELPYEILDAGHRNGLNDLYGVVPDIDRAEIQGTVRIDTEDGREQRDFDVVLRDRMGNPLVVADLNDGRDPVTGDEMESLIDAAQVVGDGVDTLGAAFYVTASFFAPDALENTSEATSNGGILSRSDRLSYVKLARKRGFHLCLAEDRNETFHLTVPEL